MKKILSTISAFSLAVSFVSCGNDMNQSADVSKSTIGISMPTQDLERWQSDGKYLKSELEAAGYNVVMEYAENSADDQINDIDKMVSDGVNLLLIAPVDSYSLHDTLENVKNKGIPVVSYDRLIMNTDAINYYVSFDSYAIGKMQGEFIRNELQLDISPEAHYIEYVAGDVNDNNAKLNFLGAYDVLKKYVDEGKLITPSNRTHFKKASTEGWSTDIARKVMETNLNQNYMGGRTLDAVLCSNDSTAFGVTQALASAYTGGNTPVITGQDGDIANLKNIVDGKQAMTVYNNVREEAQVASKLCQKILNGESPSAQLVNEIAESFSIEVNYDTNTYNNNTKYVQSYLLTPYVITKDNLQKLVDTGNYKWDSNNKYLELAE